MACEDCKARAKMARDALLKAKFAESAKQIAIGAAELVGVKKKTAVEEVNSKADFKPAKRPINRKGGSK